MNVRALITLCALVGAILATAARAGSGVPTVIAPLPFAHGVHEQALERFGLQCTDCHGFEAPPKPDESSRPLMQVPPSPSPDAGASPPVPSGLCHGCHLAEQTMRPAAPRDCALCHSVRAELKPQSHSLDWMQAHGPEGRRPRADCGDCHQKDACVSCHEARGALARDPHPPGFRGTHGLEARLDPGSCDTCHTGESCTSCHSSGGIPW